MQDPWNQGYQAGLAGIGYAANPLEGTPGAAAWAFGCGEGWKERNRRAFREIINALQES